MPIPTTRNLAELPAEVLSEVLQWLDQPLYHEHLERRDYLSRESFALPSPPSGDRAKDIANFRRICKRLAEAGAVHQFSKISTRFSQRDLERLDQFCNWPHLAKHVMKFSYLVKNFYIEGPERVDAMPVELQTDVGAAHLTALEARVREQNMILSSGQDVRVLLKALACFRKLQHVQILRVQDREDDLLLDRLRQHHELSRFFDLEWAQACAHSTSIIGKAIITSQSPCSRFSSPMLSPSSAQVLAEPLSKYMSLASRLTSLEIHFDDGLDLDNNMRSLSSIFKSIFTAATGMQAIHIGFPSHRPVSLRLEDVFHHVRWTNLKAFGIQSWKLDAEEIIQFVARHIDRLRGLRLRDVLLKEGSIWTDVLCFLRDEMLHLDWVSLRRIGYATLFEEQQDLAGVEVPDDLPGMGSDSDDDIMDDRNVALDGLILDETDADELTTNGLPTQGPAGRFLDDASDNSSFSGTNDTMNEHFDDGNADLDDDEMEFPVVSLADTCSGLQCSCGIQELYPLTAGELGDDGRFVSNNLRKMWEKWVVRRCPIHGNDNTGEVTQQ